MQKKITSCSVILILPLIALLCLGTIYLANRVLMTPTRVAAILGPPSPSLSFPKKIYLATRLERQAKGLTYPLDPQGETQTFTIQPNESIPNISRRLQSNQLVGDAAAFGDYLQYKGLDIFIQAGDYALSPALSAIQIADIIQDARLTQVPFNILEGWRVEEIAASLPTSGLEVDPDEFIEMVYNPPWIPPRILNLPPGVGLEGFLYPGSYKLPRNLSAKEMTNIFVDRFIQEFEPEIRSAISRQGLSIHDMVRIASIVEREAILDEEKPLIASVFLNRLDLGMKLDADPTVQYALGYNQSQGTWWTNPLSSGDLQVDSPYNTYRFPGLPPGPIANPGKLSLEAVAFPDQSPYLYFRAACDGSGRHQFAVTLEEHIQNACR